MPHEIRGCRRSHHAGGDFTIPGAEAHYPPDLGIEPTHLDISLAFDFAGQAIDGTVITSVRTNRSGVRELRLHGCDFENVEVADQSGAALAFTYDGREIRIVWDHPFRKGESRDLVVRYRVEEPVSGLHFSQADEAYPDRAAWAATDHETERARYWLPCVDLPAVRTTLAFHLTAPQEMTILANGLLEDESPHGDGTKTAHWRLDWPCPSYLICLAVGELVRADDESVDGREIAYFGAQGRTTPQDLLASFGRTPQIMRWLEERLGVPFPFPKYFQFGLPLFGGAMENISLVSWDDFFIADETLRKEIGYLTDIVNVHEMAHSYFGDAVVIRDFAHAWLKESWATYLEACWYEDKEGDDAFRYDLHQAARAYMEEVEEAYARPIVTRVFNSSWDLYDRHLYPGGAWRLHMLRRILGEGPFWAAVREYLETYSKKTVETADFRRLLEAHSGRSLVAFFDRWIHGAGYPKLKASFAFDKEKQEATLTLEQTQVSAKKKNGKQPAPEPFSFDLVVAWETRSGEWFRRELEICKAKHSFLVSMDAEPRQVRIDPDDSVLHRLEFNPGDGMLRHALMNGPDITARILAAEELAKTGQRKNLLAIGDAYASEPFYGVRVKMAQAVAESKTPIAVELIAGFLTQEQDPRVQVAIAAQAADLRDPRIAAALATLLDSEPTYRAAAAALCSLGAQRGEAHLERLMAAAQDEGYRSIVRSGALAGLGRTRTDAAFEFLLTRVGYGRDTDDCAPLVPRALAQAGKAVEQRRRERAVEALTDQLRDPRERVRVAAIRALGTLRATEASDAIEKALPSLAEQDHPRMRRVLTGLAAGDPEKGALAELKKHIEKIEERNRKLEERLEKLEAAAEKDASEQHD